MKTIITFAIGTLLLVLLFSFSSCGIDDLEGLDSFGAPGGGYMGGGVYDPGWIDWNMPIAIFGIDSVVQETDTTFTIWAHITCDSTLIINKRSLQYVEAETGIESASETILTEPDTIDFKSLPDSVFSYFASRYQGLYQYSVQATLPDTSTTYRICINTEFISRRPGFDYQCVVIE